MDLKSARKKICTKFFEIFSSRCHFDGLQTSLSYVPWPTLSRVNQTNQTDKNLSSFVPLQKMVSLQVIAYFSTYLLLRKYHYLI